MNELDTVYSMQGKREGVYNVETLKSVMEYVVSECVERGEC